MSCCYCYGMYYIKTKALEALTCICISSASMVRPFSRVLSANRKMIPTSSSSSSKGSLYEFQKLPYNPATPIRPQSPLESLWTSIKRTIYFVQFLVKSIPIWIGLLGQWLNPPPPKSIVGWNALVTGGSNGIGRGVGIELAKQGSNVIVADIDVDNGEKTVQDLLKYGVKAIFYKVDVSDYEAVAELGRKVESDFGHVDILVNNAGILPHLVPDEYTPENIERMMNVNVTSHFWTIKTFLPGMYERSRGHVVGLSSQVAYLPSGIARSYSTTKYAIRGFMEDLHDEIYRAGYEGVVNTTTVLPVVINTRKETMDRVAELPGYSQIIPVTPEFAGEQMVAAIRNNRRKLFVPDTIQPWQLALFEDLPRKITRLLTQELFKG